MTKSSILLMFITIFSCTKSNYVEIFNNKTQLKYESKNSISEAEFKKKEKRFDSLKNNYQYKSRNDTLFLVMETNRGEFVKTAWIYHSKKITSELSCEKKITIKSNEISFTFCQQDILSFLNKSNNVNDVKYLYLSKAKESLLRIKQNKDYNSSAFNDKLISNLISNIPFEIYDNKENAQILKVFINEFRISAWHGYDHFIIDKSRDTIASLSFIDRHDSVNLWEKW